MVRAWLMLLLGLGVPMLAACGSSEHRLYAVVDRDEDVSAGTEVKMRGDVVGQVVEVTLAESNQLLLTLSLDPEQAKLVPADSRVKLKRSAVVVGDRFLEIVPGQEGPIAEGDTLDADPSWWTSQREKIGDLVGGISDPELRGKLDGFRGDVEVAAKAGRERWDEVRPRLEERIAEIYMYANEKVPQIAGNIREQLERLLEETERLLGRGN